MNPTLTTTDGLKLALREWPCAASPARGTVLIVHGLGEHIGRYAHVAAHLNGWGWNVVGFDLRGHGRSEGARGVLTNESALLADLAGVIDSIKAVAHNDAPAAHPGRLVLLGHSMGGLVAARFCAEGLAAAPAPWHRAIDALVLSSPALDPGMNAVQKLLLTVMGALAPNLPVNNGLNPKWVSHDPAVVQAYVADPLVHDRVTAGLVRFIVDAGQQVRQQAAHWAVPTLLMWAGSDRLVAPAGSAEFARAAPAKVVATREFAPLFHEIFNEIEQGEVFAVLGEWLARVQ